MRINIREFNLIFGFLALMVAEMVGPFLSFSLRSHYLAHSEILQSWAHAVTRSSHAHLAMFGIIQILVGLTLPYSNWPSRLKVWQTVFLTAGIMGMGPMMFYHSFHQPDGNFSWSEVFLGILLSLHLVAIIMHIFGLAAKNKR